VEEGNQQNKDCYTATVVPKRLGNRRNEPSSSTVPAREMAEYLVASTSVQCGKAHLSSLVIEKPFFQTLHHGRSPIPQGQSTIPQALLPHLYTRSF
jgi:hypothetical protein